METENSQNVFSVSITQNVFSVSITHNLKIRELSDENRVIVCQTTFLLWVPPFLSYELWKLRIELRNLPIQTAPKYGVNFGCGKRSLALLYYYVIVFLCF